MPERRMAVVSIAFAVGILATDWIGWSGGLLLVLCAAAVALVVWHARYRTLIVLLAVVVAAGGARYAADTNVSSDDISRFTQQVRAFEGRVTSDVSSGSDSIRFTFRTTRAQIADGWRKVSGDVMVNMYAGSGGAMPCLVYGDRARISVRPYHPFEPTNPGQFSWKAYLARHGIHACASVRNMSSLKLLEHASVSSPTHLARSARNALVRSIERIHPAKEASVMSGIVLGSYSYIDEETLLDFTSTGTMHVLAASGYNCYMLVMLATPLLALLRIRVLPRTLLSVLILCVYLLMVGPAPSLVRAAVMSSLILLAAPLRRVSDYSNLFYVAGLIVLILDPSNLFDVGFQLSFLAVGALIYVIPVVGAIFSRLAISREDTKLGWNRRTSLVGGLARNALKWTKGIAASTAVATVAVGLVTAPVVAYYFNYISLLSLPANLIVALAMPAVFVDSLMSPLTSLLPHSAHYAGSVGTAATRVVLWTVDYFGSMKYSSISVQSPPPLAILGYYLVLGAAGGYVRSRVGKR